jgi:predicted nucleic acid-binding protein
LKQLIKPYILDPSAHIAAPIKFEVLRHALPGELGHLNLQLDTLPELETPRDIWEHAAELGRLCRRKGHTAESLDLLIAAVALEHDAVIITFDEQMQYLQEHAGVKVKVLRRPEDAAR